MKARIFVPLCVGMIAVHVADFMLGLRGFLPWFPTWLVEPWYNLYSAGYYAFCVLAVLGGLIGVSGVFKLCLKFFATKSQRPNA